MAGATRLMNKAGAMLEWVLGAWVGLLPAAQERSPLRGLYNRQYGDILDHTAHDWDIGRSGDLVAPYRRK